MCRTIRDQRSFVTSTSAEGQSDTFSELLIYVNNRSPCMITSRRVPFLGLIPKVQGRRTKHYQTTYKCLIINVREFTIDLSFIGLVWNKLLLWLFLGCFFIERGP
jgi:hypothetical protein